jgi:hypothetical protein
VTTSLNLRSEPGIGNNLIGANPTRTRLTIIGGPVCLAHQGSAYVWWQVAGWADWLVCRSVADGQLYFLEPV